MSSDDQKTAAGDQSMVRELFADWRDGALSKGEFVRLIGNLEPKDLHLLDQLMWEHIRSALGQKAK